MVALPLYIPAGEFLVLKTQSIVSMTIFGLIVGLILRRAFGAIEEPGFLDRTTSKKPPWGPS
ncbi:hypothetical protein EGH24_07290 [Halonotius terrestris]|uniref:Uncharacterized protein n=1 Tax=Halonotius terrestris TaxID=2487750 RepID=A0A8J8PBH2_9EURY|nr:hypothetical protein [Halonotius terrestris]TQQ80952.1 hypothetical protein EGH24_07290 [Halonotius terrestris]